MGNQGSAYLTCDRCHKHFDSRFNTTCYYHPGQWSQESTDGQITVGRWSCCKQQECRSDTKKHHGSVVAIGCKHADLHINCEAVNAELTRKPSKYVSAFKSDSRIGAAEHHQTEIRVE
jgi:hypothetical protein